MAAQDPHLHGSLIPRIKSLRSMKLQADNRK
jgi:hypothetical protein